MLMMNAAILIMRDNPNLGDAVTSLISDIYDDLVEGMSGVHKAVGWLISFVVSNVGGSTELVNLLSFQDSDLAVSNLMWDTFSIVGVGFLIIYFLMELNKIALMSQGNLTMQAFFAPFLKFVCGVAVVCNGNKVIGWILSANNWLMKEADENFILDPYNPATSPSMGNLKEQISKLGFFDCVWVILGCFVCALISMLVELIMIYNAYARKLEILFRVGLTPISLGDIYKGTDSTAVRYVKKLLALALYGCAFIVIVKIGTNFAMEALVTTFDGFGDSLLNPFDTLKVLGYPIVVSIAEVGALSMAKQACNEVLGV